MPQRKDTMPSAPRRHRPWLLSAAFASGVVLALTALAAVLHYLVDPNGQSLGKLGAFRWVWVINALLAVPAFFGFRIGLALSAGRLDGHRRWQSLATALSLGVLFVPTVYPASRALSVLGPGLVPAIVYLFAGSLFVPLLVERLARAFDRRRRESKPPPREPGARRDSGG